VAHNLCRAVLAPGPPTEQKSRIKELERKNRELKRANEILRTASAFFAQAELDRKLKCTSSPEHQGISE
jgi:transposase-like protein